MDAQTELISRSLYGVAILATAQLDTFELAEFTHADDAARMEDSRRRGMCRFAGVLAYLPGGFTEFALDVPISDRARLSLEYAFVERVRDIVAASQERRKKSADWLERLAQLPDPRRES
jgi:hypothetical protein